MSTGDRRRMQAILERVPTTAETVIDVGCVRHSADRRAQGSLHDHLIQHVDGDVIGVDVIEDELRVMADGGYQVQRADFESLGTDLSLVDAADVIVAGEVIEHVPNPGQAFEAARDTLRPGGRVVLTTPNPDGIAYWRKALAGQSNNETHTCWIDPAQLERHCELVDGLELVEFEWRRPTGGVSELLWRAGRRRAAAPGYVATLRRSE